MEDTPDIKRVLALQTRYGLLRWEVRTWDENGVPNSWSAECPDGSRYSFGVGQSEIDVPEAEEGQVNGVLNDPSGKELLDAIEANSERQ